MNLLKTKIFGLSDPIIYLWLFDFRYQIRSNATCHMLDHIYGKQTEEKPKTIRVNVLLDFSFRIGVVVEGSCIRFVLQRCLRWWRWLADLWTFLVLPGTFRWILRADTQWKRLDRRWTVVTTNRITLSISQTTSYNCFLVQDVNKFFLNKDSATRNIHCNDTTSIRLYANNAMNNEYTESKIRDRYIDWF